MKTVALIAVAGVAASASAAPVRPANLDRNLLDSSMYTLDAAALGSNVDIRGTADQYSNMDAGTGFVAFPAGTGALGADDYQSIAGNDIDLAEFGFVGGVDAAGGVMFFEFYDTSSNFVTSFGVQFASSGNFIYTITINSFPGGIIVPDAGLVQLVADTGVVAASNGQWFLGDAGPTVGSEDVNVLGGGGGIYSHNFRINGNPVPTPASAALLGLGGLAAARRRR